MEEKAFEYFGALAFCGVGLIGALGFVTRKWMLALARIEELHGLRLTDALEQSKVDEAMRVTMAANTTALQATTEIVRLSITNRGGRG